MPKELKKVFLAVNSCEGFISFFDKCYDPRNGWKAYIIKGGPGTGKSFLMKKAAQAAEEKGFTPIICPCSSDPDSLDGVIIEETKTVILDGTPPHTVEPVFYGACEQIINTGEFLDCKMLFSSSHEIMEKSDKNKLYHKTAAKYIAAYGQLKRDNYKLARQNVIWKKVNGFSKHLADKYIIKKSGSETAHKKEYFLSGITPDGVLNFTNTVEQNCKTVIIIEDKYSAASSIIMQNIINAALVKGYSTEVYKNPFLPGDITDHVVIPELSLAFVCENEHTKFSLSLRRIHAERFYDTDSLKKVRGRMFFNRRIGKSLLLSGISYLRLAKEAHDELEIFYKNAMNFARLNSKTEELLSEII